ncbi:MAG TPA: hypothetical protein VJ984_04785 [Xanthomonadales bacterium]|nr:hypothetical protein [Xanthomonadales bacterium]
MSRNLEYKLERVQIAGLSSAYIDEGVKKDSWEIYELDVSGPVLTARIRMTSFFISPTDPGGFHLTIFSTQEFLAQLSNIYLHLAAGFETKERETWMRECAITSRKTIRDHENIQVEIDYYGLKKLGEGVISMANARVFDDHGGLFTAKLKGLLR